MENVDVIFKAIDKIYKYDMYDYLTEEENKQVAGILLKIIKRYDKLDEVEMTTELHYAKPADKIDDDWG